jgi:uncharacterized protein
MRVGLDYDDVAVRFVDEVVEYYNHLYDDNVKKAEVSNYHLLASLKKLKNEEELQALIDEFIKGYNVFGPPRDYDGVVSTVQGLLKDGHEVYWITARKDLKEVYQWLVMNGLPLGNVFSSSDKWWLAEELDLDMFVDDNPLHLEAVEKVREHRTVVVAFDQPWNQTWDGKRVSSWEDIEKTIIALSNIEYKRTPLEDLL